MPEQETAEQDSDIKVLIGPDLELILAENEAMGFGRLDARSIHAAKEFIRRYGFEDLELRLLRKFAEVGEIQTENDISPVLEQDKKEDRFRDYLAKQGDLSQIEQGLKFRRAEDVLHSGRQDIVAVDEHEKEVTLELKIRDYTRKEVMYELDKYRGETGFRSIIVAPVIRPDMFFGLANHYKAGRIKFVEVSEREGNYQFREITPEDFSEKQKKQAEKSLGESKETAKERTSYSRDTGIIDYSRKRRRNGKTKTQKVHEDNSIREVPDSKETDLEVNVDQIIVESCGEVERIIELSKEKGINAIVREARGAVVNNLEDTVAAVNAIGQENLIEMAEAVAQGNFHDSTADDEEYVITNIPVSVKTSEDGSAQTVVNFAESNEPSEQDLAMFRAIKKKGGGVMIGHIMYSKTPVEELRKLPKKMQIMHLYDIDAENSSRYFKPIEISEEQRSGFIGLLSDSDLNSELARLVRVSDFTECNLDSTYYDSFFISNISDASEKREARNKLVSVSEDLEKRKLDSCNGLLWYSSSTKGRTFYIDEKVLEEQIAGKIQEMYLKDERTLTFEQRINGLEELLKENERFVEDMDKDPRITKVRAIINKTFPGKSNQQDEEVIALRDSLTTPLHRFVNAHARLKLKRTRALAKIDENLADAYFTHSIEAYAKLKAVENGQDPNQVVEIKLEDIELDNYLAADNHLFRTIINGFSIPKQDLSKYPYYYRMMILHGLGTSNKDKYLQPILVSASQKEALERLVARPCVEKWAEEYDEDYDCDPNTRGEIEPSKFSKLTGTDQKIVAKANRHLDDLSHEAHNLEEVAFRYIAGYSEQPKLEKVEKLKNEFIKFIAEIDSGQSPRAKPVKASRKVYLRYIDRFFEPRRAAGMKSMFKFPKAHLVSELLDIKIKRARALASVDPNLAQAYLTYSINTEKDLETMSLLPPEFSLTNVRVKAYLQRDQQLYESIVGNLAVRVEDRIRERVLGLEERKTNGVSKVVQQSKGLNQEELIKESIVNGHGDRFRNGYEKWLGYLSEDVANAGYDEEQIKQVSEALASVNVSRDLRHRGKGPDMHRLENFSQDFQLQYLIHRKVPSGEELKRLYRDSVGEVE